MSDVITVICERAVILTGSDKMLCAELSFSGGRAGSDPLPLGDGPMPPRYTADK